MDRAFSVQAVVINHLFERELFAAVVVLVYEQAVGGGDTHVDAIRLRADGEGRTPVSAVYWLGRERRLAVEAGLARPHHALLDRPDLQGYDVSLFAWLGAKWVLKIL